jgi:hypothetical protein
VLGHGYRGLKWAEGAKERWKGAPSTGNYEALLKLAALLLSDPHVDEDECTEKFVPVLN